MKTSYLKQKKMLRRMLARQRNITLKGGDSMEQEYEEVDTSEQDFPETEDGDDVDELEVEE